MFAENVAIDFRFYVKVQYIGNIHVCNAVWKGLDILDLFFILRIHDGDKKGIDMFFNMQNFMYAFADDIVKLDKPFYVIWFDVHQCI